MMMGDCRLLHVLQAGAAWKKATDEEKAPHVAAAEREKQVYQKLSADHQASKYAAAEAETAAGSLAPPQVSMQHMHSHATDPKALYPGRRKLSQNALCLHDMTGLAAVHAARAFASHKESVAVAKLACKLCCFPAESAKSVDHACSMLW